MKIRLCSVSLIILSLAQLSARCGPKVDFATFFGGKFQESALATTDAQGNIIVTGLTDSPDFPVKNSIPSTNQLSYGFWDVYVAKFDPTGKQLLFSTHLGGSSSESPTAVAADADGNIYVTGSTSSTNFPVKNAFQPQIGVAGGLNAFLFKLSADGSQLLFSSYLGGSGNSDAASGLTLGTNGIVYVCGSCSSTNFPIAGPQPASKLGLTDVFVARIDTVRGAVDYSFRFGGSANDSASSILLAPDGSLLVTGTSYSSDFPTSHAFPSVAGGQSGFISKINPATGQFAFSTYFGGSGYIARARLDSAQNIYVTGATSSTNLIATAGAVGSDQAPGPGIFVSKVTADGSAVVFTAVLAGAHSAASDLVMDSQGRIIVVGSTPSPSFPTANALQSSYTRGLDNHDADVVISVLSPDGSGLLFSTYYGGVQFNVADSAASVVLTPAGNLLIAGSTSDATFPVVNPYQLLKNGDGNLNSTLSDGFFMQISGYADVPPPLPRLTAGRFRGSIVLSWPATAASFQLQSSSDLNPTNWINENTTSTPVGGSLQFTNQTIQKARFYRLRLP